MDIAPFIVGHIMEQMQTAIFMTHKRDHYGSLYDLIQTRSGTVLDEHRCADLDRALDKMLAGTDGSGLNKLASLLETKSTLHPIWQEIIRTITIGETYFFRNQAHFHAMQTEMLPQLIRERQEQNNRQLRVWSAGCATGEEPFSLAILLRELIPDIAQWTISILATDINHEFLARAEEGVYGPRSFRGETPDWVQKRWFTERNGSFHLDRTIRDMVQFEPLNLLNDDYPAYENTTMNMDLIVCRNVTIYFELDITRRIADRFYRALNAGGWFIVGHSEPQIEVYHQFMARNFDRAVFYQKPLHNEVSKPKVDYAATLRPTQPLRPPVVQPKPRRVIIPARPKPAKKVVRVKEPVVKKPVVQATTAEVEKLWESAKQAADDEDWDTAMGLLDKADQKDNMQPQVHYLRGLIFMQIGELELALMSLRQAVYCDPTFVLAHYTLGEVYDRRGARNDAERHWHRAMDTIRTLDGDEQLPYGDEDLTPEMLYGLIDFRLSQ